jgi:hypothetical protein
MLNAPGGRAVFLLRILLCSESSHHTENNLAKFGFILVMKSCKTRDSFYPFGYLLEPIIKTYRFGGCFPSKSGEFGSFFLMKNPLHKWKSYFPGGNLAKLFQ